MSDAMALMPRPGSRCPRFRALKPGGILFAIDETMPSRIDNRRRSDCGMAVQTAFDERIRGNEVSKEERDALIKGAGVVRLHRAMAAGQFTLPVARKP